MLKIFYEFLRPAKLPTMIFSSIILIIINYITLTFYVIIQILLYEEAKKN